MLATGVGMDSTRMLRLVFLFALQLPLMYLALASQAAIVPMEYFSLGYDLKDYLEAATSLSAGVDPYLIPRFVTPPGSLLHAVLLNLLPFTTSRLIFMAVNVVVLVCGVAIASRATQAPRWAWVATGAFLLMSAPAQMLIERGNADGLVFLALAVALFTAYRPVSAAAIVYAVFVKVYAVLLVPFLVVRGRWRFAAWLFAFMALAIVLSYGLLPEYLPSLLTRVGRERFDQNISPHGALALVGGGSLFYVYAVAYVIINAVVDWRLLRRGTSEKATYAIGAGWLIPMLFFPQVVYLYSAVILVLLFIALDAFDGVLSQWQRVSLATMQALVMFPAIAFTSVTRTNLWHLIPQVSVLALSIAFLYAKLRFSARETSGPS